MWETAAAAAMDQVSQNYRTGEVSLEDVPIPALQPGGILVANAFSLISAGTERATVETARRTLAGKAASRPDLVRKVTRVLRREGLLETLRLVRDRLDLPAGLGYSSAGVVAAVAEDVTEFRAGDRVACAGQGYASHAAVVFVPRNLAARLPEGVPLDDAAYATLGAIALHGVRQAEAALGDVVLVVGLGLVGLIAVQLLKAGGVRVVGVDVLPARVGMARRLGADAALARDGDLRGAVDALTAGAGADRALLTAATRGSDPLLLAAELVRDRARIVAVGESGLDVPRDLFYRKELELRLSRSYGPGRYDPGYEEGGRDYPVGYVRWTENRNLSAFLDLLAARRVDVRPLTTHRFPLARAPEAYEALRDDALGILLEHGTQNRRESPAAPTRPPPPARDRIGVAFVGAGSFARAYRIPFVAEDLRAQLRAVVTSTGLKAQHAAKRFGFLEAATDPLRALEDPGVHAVFIATRHGSHADLAARALRAGKRVFLEKPLALTPEQLALVEGAVAETGGGRLTVGFNRRFAPATRELVAELSCRAGPLQIHYRVDAGALPAGHWLLDPAEGGGRILGEVCHFVDLAAFLCGERIRRVFCAGMPAERDSVAITMEMSGGSLATIQYVAHGEAGRSKEMLEVFGRGSSLRLDGFRHGGKGHAEAVRAFLDAAASGAPSPVPESESFHVTRVAFAIAESLRDGEPVPCGDA